MRTRQSTALNPSETAANPANVAPARPTRANHRATKKAGSSKKTGVAIARVQNSRSRNSAAVTLPRTDCDRHTCSSARSETGDNAPSASIAPPAGRKNKIAQQKAQAAIARRGLRKKFEAQRRAAANVDPAPAPLAAPATPAAHAAPAVVDAPATRPRRARPAVPRRSAPGPSVPPTAPAPPRARQTCMGDQEAMIALIGQSMHPTRAAVKQLREKAPSTAQGRQESTSDAPAAKKPRKTPGQQQPKSRGGKK